MDELYWIELLSRPLPLEQVQSFATGDPASGGIATFLGATRHQTDPEHGDLVRLEYEAYPDMATKQMHDLAQLAQDRWGARRIGMLHRLGPVSIGEVSVAIAVACAHRAESFAACRWLIDALKRDVPIWKKDVFVDGFTRWSEPSANGGLGSILHGDYGTA